VLDGCPGQEKGVSPEKNTHQQESKKGGDGTESRLTVVGGRLVVGGEGPGFGTKKKKVKSNRPKPSDKNTREGKRDGQGPKEKKSVGSK